MATLFFGGFVWADTNGVWHRAEDIAPGIFGSDEMDGTYRFNNSLYLDKDSYYKSVELENLFVNEGQLNSISSNMIVDNTINNDDIDVTSVQRRVTGVCPSGTSIRVINSDGSVTCQTSGVTHGDTYYVKVHDQGSKSSYCLNGYYLYGVSYDNSGDDHIMGFYCKKIS